jgi:hypothetical protein
MTFNLSATATASSFHELPTLYYLCFAVYEKISGDGCLTGMVMLRILWYNAVKINSLTSSFVAAINKCQMEDFEHSMSVHNLIRKLNLPFPL